MPLRVLPPSSQAAYCAGHIELFLDVSDEPSEDGKSSVIAITLTLDEVRNRLVADILNETDKHEGLLIRYSSPAARQLVRGGLVAGSQFDMDGFLNRVERGARLALQQTRSLLRTPGMKMRYEQIGWRYDVPPALW